VVKQRYTFVYLKKEKESVLWASNLKAWFHLAL
jgi:hypothetical protein